jgi:microcystin-dependent protein
MPTAALADVSPFIGQIQYYPYNFAPRSWAFCNGQLLPISTNTALFALLGTTFGGDGRTNFALPDMRGRMPVHPGHGPGLSTYLGGERIGAETVTLTALQLPSHSHNLMASETAGNQASPTGNTLARDGRDRTYSDQAPSTDMHAGSILPSGSSVQAHDNMPPFLALNCNIALTGVFPPRS